MVAFYGCLLAEVVPVPIEVPLTRKVKNLFIKPCWRDMTGSMAGGHLLSKNVQTAVLKMAFHPSWDGWKHADSVFLRL
jgi:acyl-CoA synthetase (AMP-forming)/AMP-acid ligase II